MRNGRSGCGLYDGNRLFLRHNFICFDMERINFTFKVGIYILVLLLSSSVHAQKLESGSDFYTGYLITTGYDKHNTIRSIDGVLYMIYDDIPIALVRYPAMNTRTEYEIPSTVRRICNNAFQGTKFLKTLKIHNKVTEGGYVSLAIGEDAFNDCSIENFLQAMGVDFVLL